MAYYSPGGKRDIAAVLMNGNETPQETELQANRNPLYKQSDFSSI